MNIYFIANARMPNEKAHGIHIAKTCEALARSGAAVTLVVPGRKTIQGDINAYYGLAAPVSLRRIRVPDFYLWGPAGFLLSSLFFMLGSACLLLARKFRGEQFLIYTVDIDSFSHTLLPVCGPTVAEMHTPKRSTLLSRFFFNRVQRIVATNTLIQKALEQTFSVASGRIIVEPNGVSEDFFVPSQPKEAVRASLGVPQAARMALYSGRLYRWKGFEVVPEACALLAADQIDCYTVGAGEEDLRALGLSSAKNLHMVGARPLSEIPRWLQAADVALVLGTARNEDSYKFTSPMKLFEYAAAQVPIVASATPALKDFLGEDEAFFYKPDDASALAKAIRQALSDPAEAARRSQRAYNKAQSHTWEKRAARILAFCRPLGDNTVHA